MAEIKPITETIEFEEGKGNLTQEQEEAIAREAMQEITGEKEDRDQEAWEKEADKQISDQVKEQLTDEEKAEAEKEAKAKVESDAKEKAEKEAQEKQEAEEKLRAQETEEQTKERLAKEKGTADKAAKEAEEKAKAKAAEPYKMPAEERSKAIEALALEKSLTLQEAEVEIAKEEAIVNKYKNPVEMAKALRESQSQMDKAKSELEKAKAAGSMTPQATVRNISEFVDKQIGPLMPELIPLYRKEHPDFEDLDDEKIAKLVRKDAIGKTTQIFEDNEKQVVGKAESKRAELIMGLAEIDKAFMPDIKAQLERCSPRQILSKDFKFEELVYWAKGRQLDRLVKEAEDRGFKRGQENTKIIGEKGGSGSSGGGSGTGKTIVKSSGSRLSDEQKERALDMFDGVEGMGDEDKFKAYIETYPEEFKS